MREGIAEATFTPSITRVGGKESTDEAPCHENEPKMGLGFRAAVLTIHRTAASLGPSAPPCVRANGRIDGNQVSASLRQPDWADSRMCI